MAGLLEEALLEAHVTLKLLNIFLLFLFRLIISLFLSFASARLVPKTFFFSRLE
jgi:hypothetical protein